jgi:hypothetical protein
MAPMPFLVGCDAATALELSQLYLGHTTAQVSYWGHHKIMSICTNL